MLKQQLIQHKHETGVTLIEVLVTIVILAFGLLGLAGLQAKVQLTEVESYQRAQAIALLSDMSERISANRGQAASYVVTSIGDQACAATDGTVVGNDKSQWCNALRGASEKKGGKDVGAMAGARGCVVQIQAVDPTAGVCTPGIYQVTVAWQGLHKTAAPAVACGKDSYGADSYRRAISTRVTVGLPGCV
jgi:type IV pilus assembly protein PilV